MIITIKRNRIDANMFFLFLNTSMIIDIINDLSIMFGLGSSILNIVKYALYSTVILYVCFKAYNKHKIQLLVLLALLYCLACTFSFLMNDGILQVMLSGSLVFIIRCIPAFYFGIVYRYEKEDISLVERYFVVLLFYCLLHYLVSSYGSDSMAGYMVFSYNIIFQIEFMLFATIQNPKAYRIIFVCISVIFVFAMGARGAIVCLAVSTIVFMLFYLKSVGSRTKILIIGCVTLLCSSIYLFRDKIILLLLSKFDSSRTLILLLNGSVDSTSGRDLIYNAIFSDLSNKYYLPSGVYSDRLLLSRFLSSEDNISGCYAHNFFLEVLYQFGGLFGIIICIIFLILLVNGYVYTYKHQMEIGILFAVFLSGAVELMFSSSYLTCDKFWLLTGLLVSLSLAKNRNARDIKIQSGGNIA